METLWQEPKLVKGHLIYQKMKPKKSTGQASFSELHLLEPVNQRCQRSSQDLKKQKVKSGGDRGGSGHGEER